MSRVGSECTVRLWEGLGTGVLAELLGVLEDLAKVTGKMSVVTER